jgi:hypothetical protein
MERTNNAEAVDQETRAMVLKVCATIGPTLAGTYSEMGGIIPLMPLSDSESRGNLSFMLWI